MTTFLAFALLLFLNCSVLLFKSDHRFWFVSIPLWILLLTTFIGWRVWHDQLKQDLEVSYWQSASGRGYGDYGKREKLEKERKKGYETNSDFINLVGLQTLLTLTLQFVGKRTTQKRVYKWTFRLFVFIMIFYLFLKLMMGIVPSGGIVR